MLEQFIDNKYNSQFILITGAAVGGDTTDTDNYSTFRPAVEQPSRNRYAKSSSNRQKSQNKQATTTATVTTTTNTATSRDQVKNKESSQFIPRPKIHADPYSKATNQPQKFAAELIGKLTFHFKISSLGGCQLGIS